MANITAIVGLSGAAKTLLMSNIAWKEYLQGKRIFANYYLQLDFQDIPFKDRRKNHQLNFTPIYEPKDLQHIPKDVGAKIFLDEIDAFGADNILESGVDSYNFRSKEATATEKYFKKRLRKSNADAYYTVQQMAMVPKRIREETTKIYQPKVMRWVETGNKKHPIAPYILHYTIHKIDLNSGAFRKTNTVRSLNHPLGLANHITPDMLTIYNTNDDIFFKDDKTNVSESGPGNSNSENSDGQVVNTEKRDPFRNPVTDESLYQECKKNFNHGTIVEKMDESGRYSEWKGDVIMFPPKQQPIIFDACGTHNYRADNMTTRTIHTKGKYDSFASMIGVDAVHGSKHYLAFYNKHISKKDEITKDWFAFPLADNMAHFERRKKSNVKIADMIGVMPISELSI